MPVAPRETPNEGIKEIAMERAEIQENTADRLAQLAKEIEAKNRLKTLYKTLAA